MEIDLQSREEAPNRIDIPVQPEINENQSSSVRQLIQNAFIDLNENRLIIENLSVLIFKKVIGKGPRDFFLKVKMQIKNEIFTMHNLLVNILNEGKYILKFELKY